MNLPVEVVDAVRGGRCLVFVGARASLEAAEMADAVYSDVAALAKELGWRKKAGERHPIASVEEGAAAFEASFGRETLVARLRERVGAPFAPSRVHAALTARFPLLFSTCVDDLLERVAPDVPAIPRDTAIPARGIVKLRGDLARPETLLVTRADHMSHPLGADARRQLRTLIRTHVVWFIGYRPDEEEFERLFAELSDVYGGELPRCHMAVAQGPLDDYLWQKWVWRGLLLFTADPVEYVDELEAVFPT